MPDPNSVIKRADATCSVQLLTDWADRFTTAYDIELQDWVNCAGEGRPTGPTSWDGYVACAAADALNRSRGTGKFLAVEMIEKPALYS